MDIDTSHTVEPRLMTFLAGATARSRSWALILIVVTLLAGLPIAVWLDLHALAETALRIQAGDLNSIISSVRGYYAANVVGRVLESPGSTQVLHNYAEVPGAIPIPATLSLELGGVINAQQSNITFRFISDFPFKGRAPHVIDDFERNALASLRQNPNQEITNVSASPFSDRVRLVAPIMLGAACVSCHNTHPDSPKRDWKVGDVRGIQEVTISRPIAGNILSFKYLLSYFVITATVGFGFILLATAPGPGDRGHQQGLGSGQRVPRRHIQEDLSVSRAPNLQEHLQRREGRNHPY
jgi:adenylate cyclase